MNSRRPPLRTSTVHRLCTTVFPLVRLLVNTGLRLSSALNLRVEDVDLARGEVNVRKAKNDAPVTLPIDGSLDLHALAPRDVAAVVGDYLDACAERGRRDVRIVHGKGTGAQLRTVHDLLARRDDVEWFGAADETAGGWGATLVRLRPRLP